MPAAAPAPPRARMVLYLRVSTEEQASSGLGLRAQLDRLKKAAAYHEWRVVKTIRDEGVSGKDLDRPGLRDALELIAWGKADGLAVAKLDRLSRSVIDAGRLAEWFAERHARLVMLDLSIDTAAPGGRMVLHVMAAMAQWEREVIAQRTTDSLAELRAQGRPVGRASVADSPELANRILLMREQGLTYQAIADTLNTERIPTIRGGAQWRVSSVQAAAGYRRRGRRRRQVELPSAPRRPADSRRRDPMASGQVG